MFEHHSEGVAAKSLYGAGNRLGGFLGHLVANLLPFIARGARDAAAGGVVRFG
jgi:hypothetical protein